MLRIARTVTLALVGIVIASPAFAGPPLICHQFHTGSAALLPWGAGSGWNSPDSNYDVKRLVADTTRLLSEDAPVFARMENLRRATIYATRDPKLMADLLNAVMARVQKVEVGSAPDPLAFFDAGYLVEAYKQSTHMHRTTPPAVDGYSMVRKAITMRGPSPEMEFTASLMKDGSAAAEHRRKAAAAATSGSLLARNLALFANN